MTVESFDESGRVLIFQDYFGTGDPPQPGEPVPNAANMIAEANTLNIATARQWLMARWLENQVFGERLKMPKQQDIDWLRGLEESRPARFIDLAEWKLHDFDLDIQPDQMPELE